MRKVSLLLVIVMLVLIPPMGSANENGVGNGDFNFQCGGACHGDATLNASSQATITLVTEQAAYEGLAFGVRVHISNLQTSENQLVGVFLLSSMNGANDHPQKEGWTILSNSAGTTTNYVELEVSGVTEVFVDWTLRAPLTGEYELYAAIHHGSDVGEKAFIGSVLEPLTISVQEVPENLPRLSPEFKPPTSRPLGVSTKIEVNTIAVDTFKIEWKINGGEIRTANVTQLDSTTWEFELPPALTAHSLEWRAILDGEGPQQTSPWFQMKAVDVEFEMTSLESYAQALAFFLCGIAIVWSLTLMTTTKPSQGEKTFFVEGEE